MASVGTSIGTLPRAERTPAVPAVRVPGRTLGSRVLSVATIVLAVLGSWALLLAAVLAAMTAVGAGDGDGALLAGAVAAAASIGVVAAELVATRPGRRR